MIIPAQRDGTNPEILAFDLLALCDWLFLVLHPPLGSLVKFVDHWLINRIASVYLSVDRQAMDARVIGAISNLKP